MPSVLAYYGAGLATLLALIRCFEFWRDRPNICVKVRGNWIPTPSDPPKDETFILIEVSNRGRRPVTIESVMLAIPSARGRTGKQEEWVFFSGPGDQPSGVKLQEGEAYKYLMNEKAAQHKYDLRPHQYVALASDATGRVFYSHPWFQRLARIGRSQ